MSETKAMDPIRNWRSWMAKSTVVSRVKQASNDTANCCFASNTPFYHALEWKPLGIELAEISTLLVLMYSTILRLLK